jgi:DNA-binding IclR family transcriptional regulator
MEPRNAKLKTVEKALMLLETMAEHNAPLSLTQVVQITNLSFSTAYRLMNTLLLNGFVEREKATEHYKLGLKTFLVGNAALQNIESRSVALPYLSQLAHACCETVYLAVFFNQHVIYSDCIKKNTGPIQIGIQIGVPIPACQTSSGKVLLSHLPLVEQKTFAEIYLQNELISDKDVFLDELSKIKLQGFCFSKTYFGDSISELSFPVFSYIKACIGTVSVFLPAGKEVLSDHEEALLIHFRKTSMDISRAMGYSVKNDSG